MLKSLEYVWKSLDFDKQEKYVLKKKEMGIQSLKSLRYFEDSDSCCVQ